MHKCFLISFVLLSVCCNSKSPEISDRNSVTIAELSNINSDANYKVSNFENHREFNCGNDRNYRLEIVREREFNAVKVINNDEVVWVIKTPTGVTKNGFALNYARRIGNGFSVSIEYGSRFYYGKQFDFVCRKNHFYLTEITVNYHDQADPANTGKTVRKSITPNVPLEDFTITDYMKE